MTKKILIIQLRPGLGDLCMFLPRCHEIAKFNKDHEIVLLTKKNTKADQLLKYDPFIKKIEFIDNNSKKKGFLFLVKFFFNNKFSKVYSYQYGPKYFKYIILSKLTGVKNIYHYGFFKKRETMTKRSIESNEKWLNIKINNFYGKIYTDTKNLLYKNQIVIGLGASGDNKRWPIDRYIELINKLNYLGNYEFILAGGDGEKYLIKHILFALPHLKFVSLENLNVEESIKIIKNSYIYVGNDTGFMHVCACLGKKAFCLYGDTPSEDSLYNENILPILPAGRKIIYHDDFAMEQITVDRVYSKMLSFMK